MITKIHIQGYRKLKEFLFEPNNGMNIIVGGNDAGKSTLLEAISLCLTGRINGQRVSDVLNPYWFNTELVAEFLRRLSRGFRDFMRINAPDAHATVRTRYHRVYLRSISETPHIHNECLWVLRGENCDLFGAGLRGHPVPLVKDFKITYPKRETRRQPIDNDNANANGFYLTPQRGFRRLGRPRG